MALRLVRSRVRAVRSQYPLLALMVIYTISSLWIISQPVVREPGASEAAPAPLATGRP
ncbi:MAG TPA: hypothetical protein VGW38_03770 [Chloroflexota bacterium]|nr:hypothetical protein [Chloroflexota bacterium]